jgi:hypothetical protein
VTILSMRQSTSRVCRYCWKTGEEYNVLYGTNPPPPTGHARQPNIDMDRHEARCEKNPNRKKAWQFWR